MLDHEPDTNDTTPTPTTPDPATGSASAAASDPPAGAPRRRRAASRPAGPPASAPEPAAPEAAAPEAAAPEAAAVEAPAPEAATAETPAPDAPAAEAPSGRTPEPAQPELADALPVKKPARKAATKRPAKKAAPAPAAEDVAPEVPAPGEVADQPLVLDEAALRAEIAGSETPAPRKRAPRKRATKKAAPAAEQSADDLVAEAAVSPEPAAWAGEEAVAEVPVPHSTSDETTAAPEDSAPGVPDASADDEQSLLPADAEAEAAQALTETPVADLAALADSPLSVLETTESTGDETRTVIADPTDGEPEPEVEAAQLFSDLAEADDAQAAEEDRSGADAETPVAEDSSESDDEDDEDEDAGEPESREGDGRRRRRRRGGRRRRRTGGEDDRAEEGDDEPAAADAPAPVSADAEEEDGAEDEASADDEDSSGDADGGDGSRRRRRRRRRRGEEASSAPDDPTEVVVRVREPRRSKSGGSTSESTGVTGIEGSTRMEAKRQRRRDGREAGRRRAPILSEAEFLARREAVSRKMIIRQADDLSQIAVIEDDILVEHYVDRDSAASLIGNVYLGRVQNVLPSMEAAFVDIGRGRNAVLYAGEVDWDSFGAEGQGRKVERVLKSGQTILVQVTKDPVGAKGARLTNHVSIPGRYIVYAPSGHLSGISRKLPDVERRRLKNILADLIGEASVIVRTAAEGASEEELVRDVNRLKAQWADIEKKVSGGQSPQLLYGEPDLTVRIVRDLFTEDFSELIIQGNGGPTDAYDAVNAYVTHVAPHLADRLRAWDPAERGDLFSAYRLDEQIAKGLERKVFLPSGGSLVIDRTEAMTVIDVNTGKFTGSGGNLEATVTSNNLEAAEEIVNQLRLRDIGGIIVIDFIDMVLPANRELLLRRLVECLGRDRTRHQVAEVTSLGLVQMTRKKIGTGLAEAFTSECPHCHGRGFETHELPVESQRQADGGAREGGRRDQRRGGSGHGGGHDSSGHDGSGNGSSGNGGAGGNGRGHGGAPRPTAPTRPQHEHEAADASAPAAEATSVPAAGTATEPAPSEVPVSEVTASPPAASAPTGSEPLVPEGAAGSEPAVPATAGAEPAGDDGERPTRTRRSGTRRRATRQQGAPTVADPQAAPAGDPQGEPVPSS